MYIMLQEECDRLVNAALDGDVEVISTLINDGVDMNAVIYEVGMVLAIVWIYSGPLAILLDLISRGC